MQRLAPALEASQVAWSRAAKRWGELTNPASRTDPALVGAASEVRAAIAAAATNQAGWATPTSWPARVNLPAAVRSLHLSMVASIDIAYVVRDTAADHPGLTAPARIIGMRSQGEAEIAIEQGETRYEGVTWTTRRQIAANRVIPLPEPARRGLINLADEVIATTNRAVAAAAQVDPSNLTRSTRSDRAERTAGAHSSPFRSPARKIQRQKDHAGETACHHPSRTRPASAGAEPTARDLCTGQNRCYPDSTRNGVFDSRRRRNATRQERNTIMKPLMATAAEATDMLRVGRSGMYRLIPARQRESINIGRPQHHIGRLDPPRRSQECGGAYVAGGRL